MYDDVNRTEINNNEFRVCQHVISTKPFQNYLFLTTNKEYLFENIFYFILIFMSL